MKTSLLRNTAIALALGFAGVAQAAVCAVQDNCANGSTIHIVDTTQPNIGSADVTATLTPSTTYDWRYLVDQVNPQNPATIETALETAFGGVNVFGISDLTLSGQQNGTFTVSGIGSFDYLAVHFGGSELFYHFDSFVTSAVITVANSTIGGLSNWRAYSSSVPIPGAAWLFLSALGVFGLRRKFAGGSQAGTPTAA